MAWSRSQPRSQNGEAVGQVFLRAEPVRGGVEDGDEVAVGFEALGEGGEGLRILVGRSAARKQWRPWAARMPRKPPAV